MHVALHREWGGGGLDGGELEDMHVALCSTEGRREGVMGVGCFALTILPARVPIVPALCTRL